MFSELAHDLAQTGYAVSALVTAGAAGSAVLVQFCYQLVDVEGCAARVDCGDLEQTESETGAGRLTQHKSQDLLYSRR